MEHAILVILITIIICICAIPILCIVHDNEKRKTEKAEQEQRKREEEERQKEKEREKEEATNFIKTHFPNITDEKTLNNLIHIKLLNLDPKNYLTSRAMHKTQIAISPITFNDNGIQLNLFRKTENCYIEQYYGTLYWSEILSIISIDPKKEYKINTTYEHIDNNTTILTSNGAVGFGKSTSLQEKPVSLSEKTTSDLSTITIQTKTKSYQLDISTDAAHSLINIWESYYKSPSIINEHSQRGNWDIKQFLADKALIEKTKTHNKFNF